jgi:hypothetical protein
MIDQADVYLLAGLATGLTGLSLLVPELYFAIILISAGTLSIAASLYVDLY